MRFVSDVVDRFSADATVADLLWPVAQAEVAFLRRVLYPAVRAQRAAAQRPSRQNPRSGKDGYQFGVEVIHNVGPYGYLQFPDLYSGLLATQKVMFTLAFAAVFSTAALLATRYFATPLAVALWLLPLATMQFAIGPLINSLPLDTGAFSPLLDRYSTYSFFWRATTCLCEIATVLRLFSTSSC